MIQSAANAAAQTLSDRLALYDRNALLELIATLLDRAPELADLLPSEHQTTTPPPEPTPEISPVLDLSNYIHRTGRTLRQDTMEAIVTDLQGILREAQQLFQRGDWFNAGRIFQTVLNGLTASYDEAMQQLDYEGSIAQCANRATKGMRYCLSLAEDLDTTLRMKWFDTLVDVYFKDLDLKKIQFGNHAANALLMNSTASEWDSIERRLNKRLEILQARGHELSAIQAIQTLLKQSRGG